MEDGVVLAGVVVEEVGRVLRVGLKRHCRVALLDVLCTGDHVVQPETVAGGVPDPDGLGQVPGVHHHMPQPQTPLEALHLFQV